ncbi:probable multidrug resistance-associated protein lethal(2)03659 [Stomoxys calcitrans]|uniref:probable multidrug resistance-associated protein lethal(2)03659 n=1 Tax=Stomoxys calcitrans TaxID=35570 RepID=UPI0027E3618B|nr:probable multidrug resistance-associated protein lethal(2)03659 [Stomoxys calcitrans]XP_059222916.1 probable multidrug resistance-associated protein lethal(2)03659 [Stomoxys calcitrans]XP_059222918.1 probable multidrug resistance-associated protein lethal(2)03659 [Stomoxys calcitrans]XP_059222919.1 probable multidrug resistance-associated protein lethal(2)03659 [Stomoxys calcitrans]
MDGAIIPTKENPRLHAGIFSQLFFNWIMSLLYKGSKRGLTEEDLPKCLPDDESKVLGDKLQKNWLKELGKAANGHRLPKLRNAVWHTFWPLAVTDGFICLIYIMLKSLIPLFLAQLLVELPNAYKPDLLEVGIANTTYVAVSTLDGDAWSPWDWLSWLWHDTYCLGGLLVGSTLIGCFMNHHVDQRQKRMGAKMRIACCSLIFRKATKLSLKSAGDISAGHIVNLLSNDVNRLDIGFVFAHYLWILPIQTVLIGYLIWLRMGYAAIIGVVALLLQTIPLQLSLSKWTARLRKRIAIRTDDRISKMNELIRGIPVIKMYSWEKSFEKKIKEARRLEIQETRRAAYLRSFYLSSMILPERITLFITIVAAVQMGVTMTADMIFSIANLYHVFQLVAGIFCPMGISFAAEAFTSLNRIEKFLLYHDKKTIEGRARPTRFNAIEMEDVEASWTANSDTAIPIENVSAKDPSMQKLIPLAKTPKATLQNISLVIPHGTLCAIVGPVGAGKSSIFHVILDELEHQSGSVKVDGPISYASQDAWLFPTSVKSNIVFGQREDADRYQSVIESCELLADFKQLRHGDKTLVGEGGASLSGGQKARVNLARAVYNENASVYLFDDPLSAVDARVGRELFNNVIGPNTRLLQGKTRVLITHQMQYLKYVDQIILVQEGKITAAGNWENMREYLSDQVLDLANSSPLEGEVNQINETDNQLLANGVSEEKENGFHKLLPANDSDDNKLVAEDQGKGTVKAAIWWEYFHAGNSVAGLLFIAFILLISQVICSGADYFVNVYTKIVFMDLLNQTIAISEDTCLIIYTALIAAVVIMIILRCYLFLKTCMHASKVLHERMFSCILKATMSFFDENPSGRILNRFSKDMGAMDESLPRFMSEFTHLALVMLGVLVVICIMNPLLLAAVFLVALIDYFIIKLYLRASQDLKRLEGIRRSPVFSHVSSCLRGLATIRSRNLENSMVEEFDRLQDLHSAAYHLTLTSNTALGLWLDCANVCILLNFVTFSFIIFNNGTYSGNVGLAITQAMMLTGMVQYGLRQLGESFQQMTSVERILAYTKLEQVEKNENKLKPHNWPQSGKIEYRNVSYRHKENGKKVLQNLNFEVESGSKVGIVGRTGAGKTSMLSSLFRLYDVQGQIKIDGQDCADIDLHQLRSSIAVIPQEPVLFKGTIRYNLDPFQQQGNDDSKLSEALYKVGLGATLALDSEVAESGSNLSIGQRQLLCLARAILRENKILVLDEATANVDETTDSEIQKTIRTHFKTCTVLTIAHRLKTVMDSDRILVLDAGKPMEYDVPYVLLQNPRGFLRQMVNATGDGSAVLYQIAEEAYKKS